LFWKKLKSFIFQMSRRRPCVASLDHFVLTVKNLDVTSSFYEKALGMQCVRFGKDQERYALKFGNQKINLHQVGKEYEPKAKNPTPGSGDLCFVTETKLEEYQEYFREIGIEIEEGIVSRTGASGPIRSIYIRDPDFNLIEVCNYN
jgi:catechol 2,3-dioxygenase-like lactoylglutathione lyase family enzyme